MHISRLFIYPIKSCAGVEVDQLVFDQYGPVGDRRFLIVSPQGRFLTQREHIKMAFIQPALSADCLQLIIDGYGQIDVDLPAQGERLNVQVWSDTLDGIDCGDHIAEWLSEWLQTPCRLVQLPDDNQRQADVDYAPLGTGVGYADGFPLLVVSQLSLDSLSAVVNREVSVRRFRPNVVVQGAEQAYDELNWKTLSTQSGAYLRLVKPCQRCVIPTRDPDTLERDKDVMEALKAHCRIDNKIIFGQNAVFDGQALMVGEALTLE